jgi:cell division control protein 6
VYREFCRRASLRPFTARAFTDMLSELDLSSLSRCRVVSKGRYGRTRQITVELPPELSDTLYSAILMGMDLR